MANREQLYKYKGNVRAHCGCSVEEMLLRFGSFQRMFDLHHVDPSKKDPEYPHLIKRVISTEQLDEVDKCVLLCRVCHGIVHEVGEPCEVKLAVGGTKIHIPMDSFPMVGPQVVV